MKKRIGIILFLIALVLSSFPAFAYSEKTTAIPSVRLTVDISDLSIGDNLSDDASAYVSVSSNNYYYINEAEWIDDIDSLSVGDAPRMKVYLYAYPYEVSYTNYSKIYLFSSSYSSNNVSVKNGEFISANRRDSGYTLEVTLRVKAVNGKYEMPDTADWGASRGVAKWTCADNTSGYYDLTCYRGGTVVKKLTNYKGTSYNCYPYMTKEGAYTFKVRTVPDPTTSIGKASDWLESGELYISAGNVSNGSGATSKEEDASKVNTSISGNTYPEGTGNTTTVGWYTQNGDTYFRYPNGQYVKDQWLLLEGNWYVFDANGKRCTGWYKNKSGFWYYLDKTTGIMRTGWIKDEDKWYFMNTTNDDFLGSMIQGWWTWNNEKYYFNENGRMVTGWYEIDGSWYYFYPENGTGAYGYMAKNTTIQSLKIGEDGTWIH